MPNWSSDSPQLPDDMLYYEYTFLVQPRDPNWNGPPRSGLDAAFSMSGIIEMIDSNRPASFYEQKLDELIAMFEESDIFHITITKGAKATQTVSDTPPQWEVEPPEEPEPPVTPEPDPDEPGPEPSPNEPTPLPQEPDPEPEPTDPGDSPTPEPQPEPSIPVPSPQR